MHHDPISRRAPSRAASGLASSPSACCRRGIALLIAAAGLMACAAPLTASAQEWPTKPVRVIVAFPPGGFGDVVARSVQSQLQQSLRQPVIIDNRGGAGGNIAAAEAARAQDGHTFLLTASTTESVNPLIYPSMGVDFPRALQHVGIMAKLQSFLFARPTLPAASLGEFMQYARTANKLSYGSAGSGTNLHLAGELFKRQGRFEAVHVPYRGAAAGLQDVAAGQVDFMFGPATAMSLVKGGKRKVYGVASETRSTSYPQVPTLTELGLPEVQVDSYFVLYAPASMPAAAVQRFNKEVNRAVESPEVRSRFADLGAMPLPTSPEESRRLVQQEAQKFADIIRLGSIKPD
jgi:tripartite-type tricarboxylate transporter receptor subunit TctC